jgi:hypothetical protein
MAVAAAKIEIVNEPVDIIRFSVVDIHKHGSWLVPRMLKAYPELSEPACVSWLKSFAASNEYLFLSQPHAVALFQLMPGYDLIPTQVVQERFVWVDDPKNQDHVLDAARFYTEVYNWVLRLNSIKVVIVDENTDVPRDFISGVMVEGHKCRLTTREMSFVRVKER